MGVSALDLDLTLDYFKTFPCPPCKTMAKIMRIMGNADFAESVVMVNSTPATLMTFIPVKTPDTLFLQNPLQLLSMFGRHPWVDK